MYKHFDDATIFFNHLKDNITLKNEVYSMKHILLLRF